MQFAHSRNCASIAIRCLAVLAALVLLSSTRLAAELPKAGYLVGRGIADITGPPVGIKMLGYVRPDQVTAGIHLRQWSRAFVIAEPDGGRRLAIVTTDLQSVTHSLYLSVLDKLRASLGEAYHLGNVVIAATHTHAVPGGYWQYGADTALGSPFYQEHYDALVSGIAASILAAHRDLRPGRILVAEGPVEGVGAQRSAPAYLKNPAEERGRYATDVDLQMTLLKFEVDGQPIGMLNWHAVHPTSMTFHNHLISGDNKGYAAYEFERTHKTAAGPFVAAFAQSNCGDVTPNLSLDRRRAGRNEFRSTRIIGQRQADAARRLFDSANEEITGRIAYRQSYVNFSNLTVGDAFTHSGQQHTFPAAYGYSFAAGSTEDGGGQPLFKEGMLKRDPIIEALAKVISPLPPASEELRRVHKPKPILLALGTAVPPVLPQILPLGVARIGQLALVIGPAEFTTMSGRRFRDSVRQAMPDVKYITIAGYANDYAGYVATREEYEVQHYEGAATLYGPWTQAGYQQEFARLAADLAAERPSATDQAPLDVRGTVRPTPLETAFDRAPSGGNFGDIVRDVESIYIRGARATASFWTGNPNNGYRADRRFAFVQRQDGGQWRDVAGDGDWEVKCRFAQGGEASNENANPVSVAAPLAKAPTARVDAESPYQATIEWEIPEDAEPGTHRIVHRGTYKAEADRQQRGFEAHSRTFQVQ
jgi:neutral ceramidase